MSGFLQDIRYALRQIRHNPAVSLIVVLTIALGIGVNTAVFSIMNGVDRPLPIKAPEQMVVIAADTKGDETGFRFNFSYSALQDIRREADSFTDVFGSAANIGGISNGDTASRFFYAGVTGNFFQALGIHPALGRFFEPAEGENAASELTAVFGYTFWQKQFGGDPSVIGKQVRINGKAATIIGIAPKDFHGIYAGTEMDGYMTLRSQISDDDASSHEMFTSRRWRSLTLYGRLKPGVSLQEAQAAASALARRMEQQYPDTDTGIGIRVIPERLARPFPLRLVTDVVPLVRFFISLLAGLVLLLACMNVTNVLLVRATVREREMAIRSTMGSGRWRLIRQTLTETMLLAAFGAILGTIFGNWTSRLFGNSLEFGTDLPVWLDFSFDWRVFLYGLGAALMTGIFVGVWPALRASRARAGASLHEGGRSNSGGPKRQRARRLLVAGQIAGSFVLLIGAGLLVRSLRNAERVDLGFRPAPVLNAMLNPRWAGYDIPRSKDFYRELIRRVRAWPEVQSASYALSTPLGYYGLNLPIYIDGKPLAAGEQGPVIGFNFTDGDYFDTMQMPILRGRAFRESDNQSAKRVAIVNQTMADRFWPKQDPIGKLFHTQTSESPAIEVVGVVKNGKYRALFEGPLPFVYVPFEQSFDPLHIMHIRSSVPPNSLSVRLRQEIRSLDPSMPVSDVQALAQSLNSVAGFLLFRVAGVQAAALGVLGLFLAMIGVYGVVSYGAAQRTREIGIRMALGATPTNILKMILGYGTWMVFAGIIVGFAGALAVTRFLARFLLFVSANDPFTFVAVTFGLTAVALLACYLPARHAMRIAPYEALRNE